MFSIPGQTNSSRPNAGEARFFESFESPSQAYPAITLVPPSPGLNLEAQSFFSDDTLHIPPKGSLRKRISLIRALTSRASSTDDIRATDGAPLRSAMGRSRASGCTSMHSDRSRRSGRSARKLHRHQYSGWRIIEKVKVWLRRMKNKWSDNDRRPLPNMHPGAER